MEGEGGAGDAPVENKRDAPVESERDAPVESKRDAPVESKGGAGVGNVTDVVNTVKVHLTRPQPRQDVWQHPLADYFCVWACACASDYPSKCGCGLSLRLCLGGLSLPLCL